MMDGGSDKRAKTACERDHSGRAVTALNPDRHVVHRGLSDAMIRLKDLAWFASEGRATQSRSPESEPGAAPPQPSQAGDRLVGGPRISGKISE
jgi:hypothetical protein